MACECMGAGLQLKRFRWRPVKDVRSAEAVFPSDVDSNTIFVWTRNGMMRSTDNGMSFKILGDGSAAVKQLGTVTALLVAPNQTSTLYAGTEKNGMFKSDDGGVKWTKLGGTDQGLAHMRIHTLAFGTDDPSFTTIFATHSFENKGISVSIDGGRHWRVFCSDYSAGDFTIVGTSMMFAGIHGLGGGMPGFFRAIDAGKNWWSMGNVKTPTVLAPSKIEKHRVWFGSEDGLHVTDDFGTSERRGGVGPKGLNVASISVGFATQEKEVVYAYDPGRGVFASTDGFKRWRKLEGIYVGDFVADGAAMKANADGSILYACINYCLYRGGVPQGEVKLAGLRAEPAAVVAGRDRVSFVCSAAKGSSVSIDVRPLGGKGIISLADQGNGTFKRNYQVTVKAFERRKNYRGPTLPGQTVLTVTARKGRSTQTGYIPLYVLADASDRILWDGEANNVFSARNRAGASVFACGEAPFSGARHLRVRVHAKGEAEIAWQEPGKWNGGGIDMRRHKLLCFHVRSDRKGPTNLRLALLDDGGWLGHGSANRSNDVPLSRYVKSLSKKYQYVEIPLADMLFGSAARPNIIRAMVVMAPEAESRVYDFDSMSIGVGLGPRVTDGVATVSHDGKSVRLQARAFNISGLPMTVTANFNGKKLDLLDDGKHGDESSKDGVFGGVVKMSNVKSGVRAFRFVARDKNGSSTTTVNVFVPRRAPGVITETSENVNLDASGAEFKGVPVFRVAEQGMELAARTMFDRNYLYFYLTIKDPGFVPVEIKDASPDALAKGASVEAIISSPTSALTKSRQVASNEDHRMVFAMGAKKTWVTMPGNKRWEAAGRKTAGGYVIEARVPRSALKVGNTVCDFGIGKKTRAEFRIRDGKGKSAAWAAGTVADSKNPDNWGVARFAEARGAPRLKVTKVVGKMLMLMSNKRLDRETAEKTSSYDVQGMHLKRAELRGDGNRLALFAKEPWKAGQTYVMKCPKLKAADGSAFEGELKFPVTAGQKVTKGLLTEFLIGKVIQGVDGSKIVHEDRLGEKTLKPKEDSDWRLVESQNGMFDFVRILGQRNNVIAYAHVYIYSDKAQAVQIWIGSDDGNRVVVNGKAVQKKVASRGVRVDQDKIHQVGFVKGWNTLLIGVSQGGGGWGFCARIVADNKGSSVQGMSYAANSPFAD